MDSISIDELAQLPEVAAKIIPYFEQHKVVAFYGSMGGGKTTLIRELCGQMGVCDPVTSPTFALVNQYESPIWGSIFHFDFYRIDNISEVYDMGYEEYFYSGHLCLIEWPEKIESLLPENILKIRIETHEKTPNKRTFQIIDPSVTNQ